MAAEATVAMTQPPVSSQLVGDVFVQQYYHMLHHAPGLVHQFYQDNSKLGRPERDGSMSITTTMQAINDKIVSQNFKNYTAEINSVDTQDSYDSGVQVFVTGYLTRSDNTRRRFAQVFFLAPQETGFFVLNDILRYLDDASVHPVVHSDCVAPLVDEPASAVPVPCPETHTSELIVPHIKESIAARVSKNVDVTEESKVNVADAIQPDTRVEVDSKNKLEEGSKKSYASIVMDLKESAASFSPPVFASKRTPPVIVEQQKPANVPRNDGSVTCLETVDNGNNQENEADGYSIYIKGLPANATNSLMEEVFRKFGTIKANGVQVRSNIQHGFCFGFVEFDDPSSVQKAILASPIIIGGHQAIIEEKRSRGNNRGRFQYARGSGFGFRGRGNFGGGRGYNRGEFNGKSELFNRNGSREGYSSHDGYSKSDNYNEKKGRTSWVANGNVKSSTQQVPATA